MFKSIIRMTLGILLIGQLGAQTQGEIIRESSVRATLSHLASDALMGRDTPSPGLESAATWIENEFRKAGLKPLPGLHGFRHHYAKPGWALKGSDVELTVRAGRTTVILKPGRDVRVFSNVKMVDAEDAPLARGRRRRGEPRPAARIIEVGTDSPLWRAAEGERKILKSRWGGGGVVLLVREGLLPAGELVGDLHLPAPRAVELDLVNVVGWLPGRSRKDEYVMLSAHYDHIGLKANTGDDVIANGADDDASGTTAVVELAKSLGARAVAPARSLLFVCFSGEEKGLLGSAAFAASPPVPLERIVADVNIEMIGRPREGKRMAAWLTGEDFSDFKDYAARAFKRAGVKLVTFGMARQLFRQSDNWSLAAKGVVAHSISAGSLHKDYHRVTDEVKKIDLEHMTRIIGALRELALELGNAKESPQYNEKGKAVLNRRQRRR